MSWKNVPICESCWLDERGEWHTDDHGKRTLVAVPMPVRLTNPVLERCYACNSPTIFGVFVRRDVP